MERYNSLPPEVQKIMRENPHLYLIGEEKGKTLVSREEFDAFPPDKQKYIREHPEKYEIGEKGGESSPAKTPDESHCP